ncbi:hypothetical protein M2360_000416 [Rhizobium sp. SG_E_25_P2]|uniref:hypothetical protein n=1 Tax=Rhizobium sp. SG_E_25_P2 TaxID=2879942 RepID=UPI002474958B|nr:hypothetical protein [Rhizobium sp. SG_E_25_P2]MDH6265035.1 hypothetical protein [Rhizobium sp. SG_E_25_P2]
MDRVTAHIAEPISGESLYQERARRALPMLVRQAESGNSIFYSDLADELGMSNPRNLNFVLGSIGRTLENLSKRWKQKIPPIQCLVLNKNTHLPGEGIGWFLIKKEDFSSLSTVRKRAIVDAELAHIYGYPRWREVLQILDLPPVNQSFAKVNEAAAGRGGGESESHRKMKEFVAVHPEVVGLPASTAGGKCEHPLPSGDKLDVSFVTKAGWIAVEVKTEISNEADIVRGLYQCVKYVAVMQAVEASENREISAQAFSAIAGKLPKNLLPLKNMLGVAVIEDVSYQ